MSRQIQRDRQRGRLWWSVAVSVEIAAPQQMVWDVLADFERYDEWNPFTPRVDVEPRVGGRARLTVVMGERTITSPERVRVWDPPHQLAWGLRLGGPWLLEATRYQQLDALGPQRTCYRTWERFRGPLAPLVERLHGDTVSHGFASVAVALRERVEMS